MSTVKLEIQLSLQELLKAVEQLNEPELEAFISQVMILHTQRKSAKLVEKEVQFFLKNHHDDSFEIHPFYNEFIAKTGANMTDEEYRELLRLSEQIDKLQAHRFEYLADLAHLHGVSLTDLMRSIGFQA